jgi:hypothetical protein
VRKRVARASHTSGAELQPADVQNIKGNVMAFAGLAE